MPCQPRSAITDPWRVIEWFCCSRGSRDCWLCSWYMLNLISMLKIESHWSTSIILLDRQNYTTWCYKYCHLNRTFRTAVILSARKFYGLISFCFFLLNGASYANNIFNWFRFHLNINVIWSFRKLYISTVPSLSPLFFFWILIAFVRYISSHLFHCLLMPCMTSRPWTF